MKQYKVAYRAAPKDSALCGTSDCVRPREDPEFSSCRRCRERVMQHQRAHAEEYSEEHKAMRQRIRAEVIQHYGPACKCCGEARDAFLSIDHVAGDGHLHRGATGLRITGGQLYSQLRAQGFPTGYRVLCMSCNTCLGHRGYCPHGTLTQPTKRATLTADISAFERESRREYGRRAKLRLKLDVLGHYNGGICKCCGEARIELLTIEHPGQTGAAHRKEINGSARDGRNMLEWLRRNGYPPGYETLCFNCNWATRYGAVCPHKLP